MNRTSFYRKLKEIFDENIALKLSEAIEEEFFNFDKLVKKDEFFELKGVVKELAEAQRKTEEEIRKLTKTVGNLQIEVGGISDSIGHPLEDKAIIKLPKILKENYGIEIEGKLKRGFLESKDGKEEEINIYGFGVKDGEKFFILGEGKARFGKDDFKKFREKIERFKGKYGNVFPIIITYIFSNKKLEERIKEEGIAYFLSYELENI